MTVTPSSFAAWTTLVRTCTSSASGFVLPGAQTCVTRTALKPASRRRSICAFAPTSVGWRTASSVAPISIVGPPADAGAGSASATRITTRKRCMTPTLPWIPSVLDGEATRGTTPDPTDEAGRVPLPRPEGRGPVHRQGQIAALARAVVLPGEPRLAGRDPAAPRARRGHRGDRHLEPGRGAPPRAEPRQPLPAAVQRPAPRRQVLPLHRRDRRGRVPAGHVHARAAPARRRLLRAVREREEGARDARRAQPRLPVSTLRGPEAGTPQRYPVPRLPHRPVPRSLRRLRLKGGLPPDHRRRDRVPVGRHQADPA